MLARSVLDNSRLPRFYRANSVQLSSYSSSLGPATSTDSVAQILTWLYRRNTRWSECDARLAPSLVTRSESEYLGLSAPRFAIRQLLGSEFGFLNLRRLADLQRAIQRRFGLTEPQAYQKDKHFNLIADSFLRVPDRISQQHFFVLTAASACAAYGEDLDNEAAFAPYVMQLDFLGGGVCAECVAMMAVQILHPYCKHVNGVAEINAISLPKDSKILTSGGMSGDAIISYFSKESPGPELAAFGQSASLPEGAYRVVGNYSETRRGEAAFGWALRAYIASGFPVVLSVDLTRMNAGCWVEELKQDAPDVLTTNELPESLRRQGWGDARQRRHSILVIGCDERKGNSEIAASTDQRFIVHCPATAPFLKFTTAQLINVMGLEEGVANGCFISVTHPRVQVPLCSVKNAVESSGVIPLDISFVADVIQRSAKSLFPAEYHIAFHAGPGVFRLLDLEDWDDVAMESKTQQFARWNSGYQGDFPIDDLTDPITVLAQAFQRKKSLAGLKADCPQWVWMQYYRTPIASSDEEQLWIWSAEVESKAGILAAADATGHELLQCYLVGRFKKAADTGYDWQFVPTSLPEPTGDALRVVPTKSTFQRAIVPSLINSFDVEGDPTRFPRTESKHEWWPFLKNGDPIACEYYVVMEYRLLDWLDRGPLTKFSSQFENNFTAIKLLTLLATDQELLTATASAISQTYEPNVKIVALASFFQEHAAEPGSDRADAGQLAIKGLLRLAIELKTKHNHPVDIVEIVSGTRLSDIKAIVPLSVGLPPSSVIKLPSPPVLVAELLDPANVEKTFVSNLAAAMKPLVRELLVNDIRVVLELEPGPLFINRNSQTLRSLSSHLASMNWLQGRCGFNLDISHAIQAGCERSELDFCLFDHCHISGHDIKAHVGDRSLSVHKREYFAPWLELLRTVPAGIAELPKIYVSAELEASRDYRIVEETVRSLEEILT